MYRSRSFATFCVMLIFVAVLVGPVLAQEGEPVRIAAGWGGDELVAFVQVLDASGIPYELVNIKTETELGPLVAGGNAPDIAQMPRPGQVASYGRDGALVPLSSGDDPIIPPDMLEASQTPSVINIGVVDGEVYGLMVKISSKGTVFYKPASLEALGMEPPTSFQEL